MKMVSAFKKLFKNGEDVVIVTDGDEILGGKLFTRFGNFYLRTIDGKERQMWLSEMRFVGEDGFEVIKLKDTNSILSCPSQENRVRELVDHHNELLRLEIVEEKRRREAEAIRKDCKRNYITFGDPFLIENIQKMKIFNRGNSGPNRLWRRSQYEEFLILTHKNGARGIFSDLHTVFFVG
jgi:hypothetical protein